MIIGRIMIIKRRRGEAGREREGDRDTAETKEIMRKMKAILLSLHETGKVEQ